MNRTLATVAFAALFSVACASSNSAPDPATEATTTDDDDAMKHGARIGRVAGVVAAVLGGNEVESVDDMIERYRITRDGTIATTTAIGVAKGVVEGAKSGFELDQQYAELLQINDIEVTRPYPDQIVVRVFDRTTTETLKRVAAVFANREPRAIYVQSADDTALDLREALIDVGMPATWLHAQRVDGSDGVLLLIRTHAN